MNKEKLKGQITEILTNMGYTNITFSNGEDNLLIVSFNANELTSFKSELSGWTYSGIQLDPTGERQYQIEFKKLV